jgi:hypothetical protein
LKAYTSDKHLINPLFYFKYRGAKKLIIEDILKVIYAPQKAFKQIIENPKYLGAFIILLLFIGIQVGYEYSQFSKTYTEQTSPTIDQLPTFTNASLWNSNSGATLSNNYADYFNYSIYVAGFGTTPTNPLGYFSIFGNSSLQIAATNTNSVSATLGNAFDVDCSAAGFQNLSMTIKLVQPQTTPQSATLTIYSLSDSNFYKYDLTPSLSNTSAIGLWNNLTIPVGTTATGWTSSGAPTWSNVTALKLDFTYPANSNVTIRIGSLFFRGQFQTPIQYNNTGILLQFLQVFSLQFIFGWFLITGLIYLIFRGLKSGVTWKPLFIALGFALFVMVIRALVNLAATLVLQTVYYPFDLALGVRFDPYGVVYYPAEAVGTLSAQSQAAFNSIDSVTATFRLITSGMFAVSYVWLGALGTIIVGTLKPEFSMVKRIALSAVSIAVTIVLLLLLVGIV